MSYGIYIHLPWCKRICSYCSFTVYSTKNPPFERWLRKIQSDWFWHAPYLTGKPLSIYLGGGTPSLIPIDVLQKLLDFLPKSHTTEITVEINPGDLNEDLLQSYIDFGITRLSLGIQTFQKQHARLLNRAHTVNEAEALATMVAHSSIPSWSFDLIFGLPEQKMSDLYADLQAIRRLRPPHVSLYGLTFEPNTPLKKAVDMGRIRPLNEDIWVRQFDLITTKLRSFGYERYEVSNFALPGHRSLHNEHIWKGLPYCGLGPSAHGLLPNGWRTTQPNNLDEWFASSAPEIELPSIEQQLIDLIITQIRHVDGLSLQLVHDLGYCIPLLNLNALRLGWLLHKDERLKIHDEGWKMTDSITLELIEAAQLLPLKAPVLHV